MTCLWMTNFNDNLSVCVFPITSYFPCLYRIISENFNQTSVYIVLVKVTNLCAFTSLLELCSFVHLSSSPLQFAGLSILVTLDIHL